MGKTGISCTQKIKHTDNDYMKSAHGKYSLKPQGGIISHMHPGMVKIKQDLTKQIMVNMECDQNSNVPLESTMIETFWKTL